MIFRSLVTVLEPADTYDLVSMETVKAFYNIAVVTDDPNDLRMQTLISLQSKIISDYCDRVFAHEKVEETIYTNETLEGATDRLSVNLHRWPVTNLISVQLDSATLSEGTNYRLDAKSGVLHGDLLGDELTVTYEAGYELPMFAPGPLQMAVIEEVRQSFFYGSRDPMIAMVTDNTAGSVRFFPPPGISSGRGGGGGATASSASPLSAKAAALVGPFRRPGLA